MTLYIYCSWNTCVYQLNIKYKELEKAHKKYHQKKNQFLRYLILEILIFAQGQSVG